MEEPPEIEFNHEPTDAASYVERGNAHVKQVKLNLALADYDMAIQLDPTLAEAYFLRGKLYAQEGHLNRGIADFSTAIQLNPKLAQAYFLRGNAYTKQSNDNTNAIADYSMAIQLDPMLGEAYSRRARAYGLKGNLDGATADYSKAIEVDPQYAALHYQERASVYKRQGKLEHAIADYTKLIDLKEQGAASYHFWRGNCYFNRGDLENAIADYDTTIRLDGTRTKRSVYNNRGIILSIQGHIERAASDFEQVVEQILKLNEMRRSGKYVLELGGFDMFELNDATAYCIRGGVFFAYGAAEEALIDFEAALKLAPKDPSMLAGRAISLHAVGRVGDATAAWQQLAKTDERFRDAEWVGKELGWRAELIEGARKVIAMI